MEKRTTLWLLGGCGCVLALLAIAVAVTIFSIGRRTVQRFEEELLDPELRRTRTLERLSLTTLPPDYYPVIEGAGTYQFALFSNQGDLSRPYDFGFVYLNIWNESHESELRPLFEGPGDQTTLFRDGGASFDIQLDETMEQGVLETSGATVRYRTAGGRVSMPQPFAGDHHLLAMLTFECERGPRYLVWFGPDPREGTRQGPDETDPLSTSVVNPAWIEQFVSYAPLCDQGLWSG